MNDLKQQLAPGWSAVNIGVIVVLFVIGAWPLALMMIAYIIWGRKVGLDLSQPHTLAIFGKRVSGAWKAAVAAFSNNSPSSRP